VKPEICDPTDILIWPLSVVQIIPTCY